MATPKKSKAKLKKTNSTGYNGVTKLKNGKYVGQSWFDKKNNRTKQFAKAIDAAKAYDEMVTQALAEGKLKRATLLNFPNQ